MQQFAGRRDVLKARAALAVVDDVLRTDHRDGSDALGAELERITAGAHDLVELRVLDLVRSGAIPVREEERDAVERLLGAEGARPASRLGLAGRLVACRGARRLARHRGSLAAASREPAHATEGRRCGEGVDSHVRGRAAPDGRERVTERERLERQQALLDEVIGVMQARHRPDLAARLADTKASAERSRGAGRHRG